MKWSLISYSWKNLVNRKLRSWLTSLSILIGIMAVFALVSFGLGIQNYVNSLAEEAGTNKLIVQAKGIGAPGTDSTFSLSQKDVDHIDKINGVDEVAPIYMSIGEIVHDDERAYAYVMAVREENMGMLEDIVALDMYEGRKLEDETDKVVLGYNYVLEDKAFERPVRLNDKVIINDVEFEVVGFYEEVGNPADDVNIYLSFDGFELLYPESAGEYSWVIINAEDDVVPGELADKVEEELRDFKDQEEGQEEFTVQTFSDVIGTFNTIINLINGVLFLIALISVVVASVNITNTMYTSVLERTKEIGIMKAIGARNSDIRLVFIVEAGLLGLAGGAIGVLLGYGVAKVGEAIAANAGYAALKPIFPWYLVAGCLVFAYLVGTISGVLPAIQAAKKNPVDALRYE